MFLEKVVLLQVGEGPVDVDAFTMVTMVVT